MAIHSVLIWMGLSMAPQSAMFLESKGAPVSDVQILPIDEWVQGLCALPAEGFTDAVNRYLRAHIVDPESLGPYTFWRENFYTRNLIYKCDRMEIMALCWDTDQESPIHNHRDQQCWVVMGQGELHTQNFNVLSRDDAVGSCSLQPSSTSVIGVDSPVGVEPDGAIHLIANRSGHPVVSIHIYALPFDSCEIYDLEAGTFKTVKLSYWSTHGRLCSASA
jgi:cysteine dioxygenase